jgi:hypothetical protein
MEAGTQFIGVKPGINMQERKSNVANNPTDVFTIDDIRGGKLYAGVIDTNIVEISSGDLVVDQAYVIKDNSGSGDFTNVGASDNLDGTYFVATGTTPTDWGHPSAVLIDISASSVNMGELFNSLGFTPEIELDISVYYPDVTVGFNFPPDFESVGHITNVPRYTDGYVYALNDADYNVTIVAQKTIQKQPIQITVYE